MSAEVQKVIVTHKKLGRHGPAAGRYEYYLNGGGIPQIQIDPRWNGKARFENLLHEASHHVYKFLDEPVVRAGSRVIARILWAYGYRLAGKKGVKSGRKPGN